MSGSIIKNNQDYMNLLPQWANEFSTKYCSKTANLYCIHGNVRDFLPHRAYVNHFSFVKITDYISDVLFGNKHIIAFFDTSCGVSFSMEDMMKEYLCIMHQCYPDIPAEDFVSREPTKAFYYLERYFIYHIDKNNYAGKRNTTRMVLIIDYAETVVPADEINNLNETDRYSLVTLNRWAHEPIFTREDVSIVMITENLSDVNSRITTSPSVIKIGIPFPDETVRIQFLKYLSSENNLEDFSLILDRMLTPEKMGALTSGLNLFHLHRLAAESYQKENPITREYLIKQKEEIIESEASGLLEFINTGHNLSFVSGHEFVKNRFKSAVKAIMQRRFDALPMGYLISGPIGTGKSFMVSAFAGEIGIPMVRLCNFRSQWQGTTESNLERVINILKAMSPVAVMIDEADAVLGNRKNVDGSGTSGRVFAQIANFMGDTTYRGKIIWFLITSRPDLLPIDLKRQGRAEEHLALFYPETDNEKTDLFLVLQRKLGIKATGVSYPALIKNLKFEISGADIESILVRAKMTALVDGRAMITQNDLEQTLTDFIPPSYPYEIELQNLVAALECTSKEMVPKKYRNITRQKIAADIMEIKQLLGEK